MDMHNEFCQTKERFLKSGNNYLRQSQPKVQGSVGMEREENMGQPRFQDISRTESRWKAARIERNSQYIQSSQVRVK